MSNAEQVRDLADKIKENLTFDNSNGVLTPAAVAEGEPTLYEKLLPESLTPATVKAVKTYDTQFVAGTTRAVHELARAAYDTNPELNSSSLTIGMFGKDTMTVTANRDGTTDVSVVNRAVDPSAGELKKAVREFKDAMATAKAE